MSSLDTPRIKVLTIGSSAVGKSCFIKRYCEERFVNKYVSTIGIDYGVKKFVVSNTNKNLAGVLAKHKRTSLSGSSSEEAMTSVRVNFWDVAGDTKSFEIRNEFYTAAQGIFILFDVTNRNTFEELETLWWPELLTYLPQEGAAKGGASGANARRVSTSTSTTPAGRAVGEESKSPIIVLCGNKCDDTNGNKKRVVTEEEARQWATSKGIPYYYDTSASSGLGVTEAMETVFYEVLLRFYYS